MRKVFANTIMNNQLSIYKSRILRHPKIIWTILKNVPTLDPLVIFMNAPVYMMFRNETLVSFVSIKHWGNQTEFGTLYTFPDERGKGYAKDLCIEVMKDYGLLYLLCKPDMVELYSENGFSIDQAPSGIMGMRKRLFDIFIAPFVGYTIVVMKRNQNHHI